MPTRASTILHRRAPVSPGLSALVLGVVACILSGAWSAAAAPPANAEDTPPPVLAPPAGASGEDQSTSEASPSQVPPELQSSYLVRVYTIRPAKLFKGLLEALKAEGYPPEEVDGKSRTVKTSFVDFKQGDFELQVAEPPPRLGGNYHILQLIKMKIGKVSLEGVVASGKDGSELRMRARILVTGLDRVKRVHVFVDRRSTGVIEADFIHKLEARMGLEHL
jgi:hypothetical protein